MYLDLRSFHLVQEKKSFEKFLHYQYMGMVATSHATWTSYRELFMQCPIQWIIHMKFDFISPVVSENEMLESLFLFVFVAFRPKSTAMVMVGRSVDLTTLFPGQA